MEIWESSLEALELNWFNSCYKDKRVLVTGHNGFKGAWLSLWLKLMGADIYGLSLESEHKNNHLKELNINVKEAYIDIRNYSKARQFILDSDPHFVFHMAAQPLVLDSYDDPINTWTTNVIGTVNILEICRELKHLLGLIVVTTDKCYENFSLSRGYKETDILGGSDPYSASKAGAEIVTASYRRSFYENHNCIVASARAGNVIGGGDWSKDRLIPDLIRSIQKDEILEVRSPKATRPWQHVCDCLNGYLHLGQKIIEKDLNTNDAFNFGPEVSSNKTVEEVLTIFLKHWPNTNWKNISNEDFNYEAKLLHLDSTKAKKLLGWEPVWDLYESLEQTSNWYKNLLDRNVLLTKDQIIKFMKDKNKHNEI